MTVTAVWSSRELPHERTPGASPSELSDLHMAWALSPSKRERLDVWARYRKLETLRIGELRTGRLTGRRPAEDRSDAASVGVLMNLSGRICCRYLGGREFVLNPGQLMIWDSELADDFEVVGPHRELYLLLPRTRIPPGLAQAAVRPAGAMSTMPGMGLLAIAGEQLRAINRELEQLSNAALAISCQSLFDVLDSALSRPEVRPSLAAALVVKVRQYIEDNLDDPGLHPASIAAAHGISVRTLHQIFAGTGMSVSQLIRDRRLKACFRELSHGGSSQTVTDVAFRWGFNDAAHFSRRFRQAFGVTPSSVLADARSGCLRESLGGPT